MSELEKGRSAFLPKIYFKFFWLLGQKVQHSLLLREGIDIPSPDELRGKFRTTSDMLNYRQSKFGCKFDWNSKLFVTYKGRSYNIFKEIKEIITECITGDIKDAIGFDVRGIDFPRACKMANSRIIDKIVSDGSEKSKIYG
ncbi:MAG: hypothetical protein HWN67_15460 [Candidatus Helarchaeota archaeon]|nr:hypothetical protein [Candidatus Helarchaeota archaeon]